MQCGEVMASSFVREHRCFITCARAGEDVTGNSIKRQAIVLSNTCHRHPNMKKTPEAQISMHASDSAAAPVVASTTSSSSADADRTSRSPAAGWPTAEPHPAACDSTMMQTSPFTPSSCQGELLPGRAFARPDLHSALPAAATASSAADPTPPVPACRIHRLRIQRPSSKHHLPPRALARACSCQAGLLSGRVRTLRSRRAPLPPPLSA